MPWSAILIVTAIILALIEFGALLILILISPWIWLNSHIWHWFPAVTAAIAGALGVKPPYVWAGISAFSLGIMFAYLSLKIPRNSFYRHAAILLLGLLAAAAMSVRKLSGWPGV